MSELEPEEVATGTNRSADAIVSGSKVQGVQTFSLEQGKLELRAEQQRFKSTEEAKDNDLRRHRERLIFYAVLAVLGISLVVGFIMASVADDNETRRFGRDIVHLLLGAIGGGVVGLVGGKVR